jgi:hypothetical protein
VFWAFWQGNRFGRHTMSQHNFSDVKRSRSRKVPKKCVRYMTFRSDKTFTGAQKREGAVNNRLKTRKHH